MNLPLHQFLTETFGKDVLRDASIVADNPRGRSSQAVLYYTDDEDDLLSIGGHGNDSLRSLPSLTSESSVSRWDSCISSPNRKNDSCKSPPGRPTRGYVMDKMSTDPIKPIHLLLHHHHRHHHMHSPTAAKTSDLKNRLHTPPSAPRRRVSFQDIPRPPCLEALDSPTSVRMELSELLSKALEECGDLQDTYCDSSISSNTDEDASWCQLTRGSPS